ncbi:hypothetical protein SAMN05445060_2747 [Williamsia sterculiae]|uniref:Uncharacterized protein n=1 Tax=Williamsia sterculiae TaxID=1344003 RepID=A0A1N7GG60_9NOCA|nr:hypothetical protein SAMN05445060_2747 [Williamsia sterculiae]
MAKSKSLTCSQCGTSHTGTWSATLCPDCAKKSGQTKPDN